MNTTAMSEDQFLALLQARLKINHTDEQLELIKRMTSPTICFASPGTGKTCTAVSGLLYAELFKHVPGQDIYALSFTNMATAELCVRHKKACDALELPAQTVNFRTLHSLCASILGEYFRLLSMSSLDTSGSTPIADSVRLIDGMCRERGVTLSPKTARNIVLACRSLNSSMIFDQDHVCSKKEFKDTHVDYKLFTQLRYDMYQFATVIEIIPVDNIMLYTLQLLTQHPEVSVEMKKRHKIMLIDEAQDFSLLHMRVVSLITDCPILIGDMKQQIYAFNGACQEIVEQFAGFYPARKELELNQSFRCKNEIIEYASEVVKPNNLTMGNPVGTGPGGSVNILTDVSFEDLANQFSDDYVNNNYLFSRDTMFLFRNNASAVPLVEALFQKKVPFRTSKYISVIDLPVIRDLVDLLNLCRAPNNCNYVGALSILIPELRTFRNVHESPFYAKLNESACDIFTVNYTFNDLATGSKAMTLLSEVSEMMHKGHAVMDLFNKLWGMYYGNSLKQREWQLDYPVSYYIRLAKDLVRNKTFDTFIKDEADKLKFARECNDGNRGIRCYTMHAAKGLEADDVYILDADEGLIPNLKSLDRLVKSDCSMDAAREIRNERSLCYVALTRARDNVYIVHNGTPASMLLKENEFESFDETYKRYKLTSDDIGAFNDFIGGVQ